jgi:pyruvate dehydrogenase E2 component (dihydrolipoamide acetyltransferase)
MFKVVLPELGEGINKATVSYWLVEVGKEVKEGDELVEMATDKAVFNVPSPSSGVLKQIIAQDGQEIKVGDPLAVLE